MRLQSRKNKLALIFSTFLVLSWITQPVQAMEAQAEQGPVVPCAVVEDFHGEVQILDVSRTEVSEATKKTGISCGGWVSITSGWLKIRHRDGMVIHLGPQTFAQITDQNTDGHPGGEQAVLMKGELFGSSRDGAKKLQVITANGKVTFSQASGIVIYNRQQEETQVIALESTAHFENRFEPQSATEIREGETSSLNFKLLRVHPSNSAATSVAALRPKLRELHLSERDQSRMIQWVKRRTDKVVARNLSSGRSPASVVKTSDYRRHPQGGDPTGEIHSMWARKMTAGVPEGEKILYPEKFLGRKQSAKVVVMNPSQKIETEEKKKLIEELSQIRDE